MLPRPVSTREIGRGRWLRLVVSMAAEVLPTGEEVHYDPSTKASFHARRSIKSRRSSIKCWSDGINGKDRCV
jgi:hypothetical protein